ncbi:hypothetical protein LPB73_01035 [Tardiphaga sp. 37S4]|uniref:hypothetical protein n=1 Tax=Tardiphaga sp. 37S4 TaxID=1404741 RepID=UPI001E3A55B6|nr:hypothetical protein [Tardiphaga sp. 37S4]UFS76036.1 hypothetical protein LPB73_01035 [Tardiphaga sp. 37S4]
MALVRPRLTEFHGIDVAQANVDFAIPFLEEDLPLYVDPFLLWKSPSLQDQSLHGAMVAAFNRLGMLSRGGQADLAVQIIQQMSECEEVGLGGAATKKGKRIGLVVAQQILSLFEGVPMYAAGFTHFEEIQLFVDGISKDRVSDIACNLLKSFLIDYTIEQCERLRIPRSRTRLANVYDHQSHRLMPIDDIELPISPTDGSPILLVPKRWLRHSPWIGFDDYFKNYIPKDDQHNKVVWDRVSLLNFNRHNYGVVQQYIAFKERAAADCATDPLFSQIPLISAKRKLAAIQKLPSGKDQNADRKYEDLVVELLANMFYPQLDYADDQVRTDSGAQIRDLIFYMNREADFLSDVFADYGTRQLVCEIKNVRQIEREHINQLNRYLSDEFGRFGVLVTRNPLPKAMRRNTVDLWSGQRRCIIPITDEDLSVMVDLFEDKRRPPLDVLKRSYLTFKRECPS